MPYYYDDDGELAFTQDQERKERKHVSTMLRTSNYGLSPGAAGRLMDILGETDPKEGRKEARKRIRNALEEAGLGNVPFSVAVEALDDEWQAKVRVGDSTPSA